jgi:hypothetical protein
MPKGRAADTVNEIIVICHKNGTGVLLQRTNVPQAALFWRVMGLPVTNLPDFLGR